MGGEWFLMAYQRFIRVVMRVILLLVGTIELEGRRISRPVVPTFWWLTTSPWRIRRLFCYPCQG